MSINIVGSEDIDIITHYVARCDRCGETFQRANDNTSLREMPTILFEHGWRKVTEYVCCPDCVEEAQDLYEHPDPELPNE